MIIILRLVKLNKLILKIGFEILIFHKILFQQLFQRSLTQSIG